jgi:hypothetical protein
MECECGFCGILGALPQPGAVLTTVVSPSVWPFDLLLRYSLDVIKFLLRFSSYFLGALCLGHGPFATNRDGIRLRKSAQIPQFALSRWT